MALPEVTAKLDADVSGFIKAWEAAAAAATRAAAQIRAAMAAASGDIDVSGISKFREEVTRAGAAAKEAGQDLKQIGAGAKGLEQAATSARKAAESMRAFGQSSKQTSSDTDKLGESARRAGQSLGGGAGGGGGGLLGGLTRGRVGMQAMAAAVVALAAVFPAIAAAALATGAALQGLGVAGLVVAGGWRGIEQAGERLKASMGGLQKQLESVFRAELSQEFTKLGHAISSMDGPLKGIARSISDVVKEFTGWVRSADGMREIETMLGGVDNMVKSLAPGAKALGEAFTGFGAAAAPAMDDIGKALSSVFENLNKVVQKHKETGQLTKAFEAGAAAIEAFGEVVAGVVDILIEMAAQGGKPAADAIKKFGQAMQDAAPTIGLMFGALARAINVIATIVGWFAKLLKALEPVTRKCQEAAEAWDKLVMKGEGFKKLGVIVAAAFELIKKAITDGVNKSKESVKKWWEDTKKAVDEGVKKVQEAVKKWWEDTKKRIDEGVKKAQEAVKKWWEDTKKAITEGVKKAVEEVKKWWDDTTKAVEEGVDKAVEAIAAFIESAVEEIEQGVDDFISKVEEWWDETVAAIKEGVDKAIQAVKDLPTKAKQALDQAVKDFKKAGSEMGDGLVEGLRGAAGKLAAVAVGVVRNALMSARAAMGIRSPSTVMRDEVGAMMSAGLAEGILANSGLVSSAMARTALGAVGAGRVGSFGGAATGRGGQTLTLQISGGADSAVGVMIARLAQQGKLKITANAVVGGRR